MLKLAHFVCAAMVLGAVITAGCGSSASTSAPPITGKRPDWKTMTKEEKIELLKKTPMPPQALQDAISRVEQGID